LQARFTELWEEGRGVTEVIGTVAEAKLIADVVNERLNGTFEESKEPSGARLN